MHKSAAKEISAIKIYYDTSGQAEGVFYSHSHSEVYMKGFLVQTLLVSLSMISIIILIHFNISHLD